MDVRTWPLLIDSDDIPKRKLTKAFRETNADNVCYIDFSVSTTGVLAGIRVRHRDVTIKQPLKTFFHSFGCVFFFAQMTHASTRALCHSVKRQCELYPSRDIALCLDPYSGLGFVLWCLSSVYSGHRSVLIPPAEVELNPALWLSIVSQFKGKQTSL